jgi:hypothetical protein
VLWLVCAWAGNYTQASKTAVIIARQEQDLGNYKVTRRSTESNTRSG